MARSGGTAVRPVRRRLATVMFIDIAQSTELAAELGDRRWRELLQRFRQVVRRNLKKYNDREQDTAGDGFYATFDDPSMAVYAAVACARDSNEMGLNVRVGLHVGECDFIDGRLGGMAAAIGSRLVSIAQPGQVVATTTVRDMTVGSSARFGDLGVHELKGVPGTWQVLAIDNVDGALLPVPVQRQDSASRIAASEHVAAQQALLRKRRVLIISACVVLVAAVAIAVPFTTSGGRHVPVVKPKPAVFAINPSSDAVMAMPTDGPNSSGLYVLGGALWESTPGGFVRRDSRTGAVVQQVAHTFNPGIGGSHAAIPGLNAFWLEPAERYPYTSHLVQSLSPIDGHALTSTSIPGGVGLLAVGQDAVWDLTLDTLYRIDPSGHITNTWPNGIGTAPAGDLVVTTSPQTVWFATATGQIYRFSPRTGRATLFHDMQATGRLVNAIDASGRSSVWYSSRDGSVFCITDCGDLAPFMSFGVGAKPTEIAISGNAAFVAAGNVITRIDLAGNGTTRITMPVVVEHIVAGPGGTLWADNCFCDSISDNYFNGGS